MATSESLTDFSSAAREGSEFEYQALSTGAIVAAIFGALSPLTIFAGRDSLESCLLLVPIPLVGLVVGIRALASIRAMPDQLSGRNLALGGVILSAIGLIGGLSYAGYVHATEVPPDAIRTSFQEFRPEEQQMASGMFIPKKVQDLDGKRVFIKGYMRADSTPVRHNVRRFLLVRDNNQCCFGDMSNLKYYDQVLVQLADNVTTDYSTGLYRIAGTLHLHPENLKDGLSAPVYTLEADYVR
ncbi:DUF4190 domain-containing protein [Bythopirellula polymerisocia]|uniref:DUF4190 domain-containing protein n=1 Tax=Bythopirellula polymerisocia TaxID=2528003 RepID=A0A5C6CXN6_9BACT|nr:DUF4190 domain-containing protein [Bythopirellula polymerisocia]TWU28231.1 hypothetical protein Pla144_15180 [Bythopirellula polymerisocia]